MIFVDGVQHLGSAICGMCAEPLSEAFTLARWDWKPYKHGDGSVVFCADCLKIIGRIEGEEKDAPAPARVPGDVETLEEPLFRLGGFSSVIPSAETADASPGPAAVRLPPLDESGRAKSTKDWHVRARQRRAIARSAGGRCPNTHPHGVSYFLDVRGVCSWCGWGSASAEELERFESWSRKRRWEFERDALLKSWKMTCDPAAGRRVRVTRSYEGAGSAITGDGNWSHAVYQHGFFGRNESGETMGGCW